jgi:hypothetical protein
MFSELTGIISLEIRTMRDSHHLLGTRAEVALFSGHFFTSSHAQEVCGPFHVHAAVTPLLLKLPAIFENIHLGIFFSKRIG